MQAAPCPDAGPDVRPDAGPDPGHVARLPAAFDWRPDQPATLADPFPAYRRLRDEDPAHYSPHLRAWVLTRYADVRAVLLDPSGMSSDRLRPFFASLADLERQRIAEIIRYLSLWMVFTDPPDHTRLRKLTSQVFSVATMNGMRPRIEALVDRLLGDLEGRERIDFVADFAGPLPALVIMDMLGVPGSELPMVKALSDRMALFIGSARASPEKYAIAEGATRELAAFFRQTIQARRKQPADDLITRLIQVRGATAATNGDRLTDDELVATCILLLFAGHETTTNHIANGLLSLIKHPDQMAKLRADRGRASAAVEELLRHDGPSIAQVRVAAKPWHLHGRTIQPGDRVFLMLNAANRDERAYPNPDRVDMDRDGPPHLTFGFGMHICLGFPLARLEGQIALPEVLAKWPRIECAVPFEDLEWLDSMVFRGMKALPLVVGR